ncbi:MAG: pyruvate, water dikinase regulatory protein [Thalassotalea sp.]
MDLLTPEQITNFRDKKLSVFYISDGTAITAEVFGQALFSVFSAEYDSVSIPFVENNEKAHEVKALIEAQYRESGELPIVFHTYDKETVREIVKSAHCIYFDFLGYYSRVLQSELGLKLSTNGHKAHTISASKYNNRMAAVNFTLEADDGANLSKLKSADIILIGVSRTGKTPTSVYLAMHYGVKVANYPFTADDMFDLKLPKFLKELKPKLFGLTINQTQLHQIRSERRMNSSYASMAQCKLEISSTHSMYRKENIPFIDSSNHSVEEMSAKILEHFKIER